MSNIEEISRTNRIQLNIWMEMLAQKLNLKDKCILEIGIAGDEYPSGSYKYFGQGNHWTTMDIAPKWKPDICTDLTCNELPSNSYDLIIMVQTIEHIWDYKKALSELHRISKQHVIVDSPFMYPFHQDKLRSNAEWQDWDDYWRFTPACFKKLLLEAGFKEPLLLFNDINTICLAEIK